MSKKQDVEKIVEEANEEDTQDSADDKGDFTPYSLFLENVKIMHSGSRVEIRLLKIYLDRIDGWTWGSI